MVPIIADLQVEQLIDSIKILDIKVFVQLWIEFIFSYKFQLKAAFFIKSLCLKFVRTAVDIVKSLASIKYFNLIYQLSTYTFPSISFLYDQFINIYFRIKVSPVIAPTTVPLILDTKQNGV